MQNTDENNIAALLREIAVNKNDKDYTAILKKAQKLANKGKTQLRIRISKNEFCEYQERPPPYCDKLREMGFKLMVERVYGTFWDSFYLDINW